MLRLGFLFHMFILAGLIATVNISEAAGLVETRNVLSLFTRRIVISHHNKRQAPGGIPDVPPQCASDCNTVTPILALNSCPINTCCSASFEMSYFNCFNCLENLDNETNFSEPQQLIDALINDCASVGIALPKLTFPGQNPNRGLSSVSRRPSTQSQLSLPQTATKNSASPNPTSAIQQTTVTPTSTLPTSSFSQVTVTAIPSTTSSTTSSSASPTDANVSSGIKSADSGLMFGMSVALLWVFFYFAL